MENKSNALIASLVLALGLVLAAGVGSYTFYRVRSLDNSFQVTGSAKQQVTSDVVKWTSQFTRTAPAADLKGAHQQIASDLQKVIAFYKSKGVKESDLIIPPVQQIENINFNDPSAPHTYTLTQTVQLQSNDVQGVTAMAKNTESLTNQDIIFSTQSLEYNYSKLPDLRVSLLGEAVNDAKSRADKIAESGVQRVGSLKSACVGVVQVLPVNSVDISDYGSYDTQNIEKQVMVTVKVTFAMN
jgi:hypothetical protein